MRLLFDQNISYRVTKKVQSYFSDCKHVSDCKLSDKEDPGIWQYAKKNDFAIVTFDSDYYDMSIINGHPPMIIWIRSGNLTTNELIQLLIKKQKAVQSFLEYDEFKDIACLELEK
jgi:predicted nuclease of predicted toxin-antitoxin system